MKAANKRFGFNMTDLNVLRALSRYDVIVVNGPFSTSITLAARFFHKKLVYLDTILRMPNHWLHKFLFKFNTVNSSGTVMYSFAVVFSKYLSDL